MASDDIPQTFGEYLSESCQVRVQVANGGYIIHWWNWRKEEHETSVFTDLETLARGFVRIVQDMEGSGELEPGTKLGGLNVEDR